MPERKPINSQKVQKEKSPRGERSDVTVDENETSNTIEKLLDYLNSSLIGEIEKAGLNVEINKTDTKLTIKISNLHTTKILETCYVLLQPKTSSKMIDNNTKTFCEVGRGSQTFSIESCEKSLRARILTYLTVISKLQQETKKI